MKKRGSETNKKMKTRRVTINVATAAARKKSHIIRRTRKISRRKKAVAGSKRRRVGGTDPVTPVKPYELLVSCNPTNDDEYDYLLRYNPDSGVNEIDKNTYTILRFRLMIPSDSASSSFEFVIFVIANNPLHIRIVKPATVADNAVPVDGSDEDDEDNASGQTQPTITFPINSVFNPNNNISKMKGTATLFGYYSSEDITRLQEVIEELNEVVPEQLGEVRNNIADRVTVDRDFYKFDRSVYNGPLDAECTGKHPKAPENGPNKPFTEDVDKCSEKVRMDPKKKIGEKVMSFITMTTAEKMKIINAAFSYAKNIKNEWETRIKQFRANTGLSEKVDYPSSPDVLGEDLKTDPNKGKYDDPGYVTADKTTEQQHSIRRLRSISQETAICRLISDANYPVWEKVKVD